MATSTQSSHDDLLVALKSWVRDNPEQIVALVGEDFDIAGQQEAVRVQAKAIDAAQIDTATGKGTMRVALDVLYRNPGFDEDEDLSATNVTDYHVAFAVVIDPSSGVIQELERGPLRD